MRFVRVLIGSLGVLVFGPIATLSASAAPSSGQTEVRPFEVTEYSRDTGPSAAKAERKHE